jgi:tetratricopeptide (TPR) repeat protein
MPQWLDGLTRSAGAVTLVAVAVGATCGAALGSPVRSGRATDVEPTSPSDREESTELLARCRELIRGGRSAQARELLEPAVARRPDWAEAHAHLGFTYFNEKRWEAAKACYERALELDPELHAARVPYGWCLYYLGQLEASRESFQAFLEVDPEYPDAIFALALIDIDRGELESAERLLRRVVMLTRARRDVDRQALAHARLGDVYVRNGELSRAKLELRQSIRLDPDNPKTHFKMSRVLQLMGDDDGAAEARRTYEELRARAPSTGRVEAPPPKP